VITRYLSPLSAIACRDRSYARRPSFPTTLLSSDLTLMSTDITPMQVDITALQVGTGPMSTDITPLPTAMGLMSPGLTLQRVDVARLATDLTVPSTGGTPRSIVIHRLSLGITPPSVDRTMRKTVLTAFASGRWSSGGEPGRGPTAGGRPEAGKRCSLPFSSHKEVGMSRFPRTEAEITALALLVVEGLTQAPDDLPAPPVPPRNCRPSSTRTTRRTRSSAIARGPRPRATRWPDFRIR
jgi:hypothetical protein